MIFSLPSFILCQFDFSPLEINVVIYRRRAQKERKENPECMCIRFKRRERDREERKKKR